MSKKTFIVILLFFSTIQSFSQMSSFDILKEKMFFNIFINKPDTVVANFISKYFPGFCSPPINNNWAIYPKEEDLYQIERTEHSLFFNYHPFFNCKFKLGKLEFSSTEGKGFQRGVSDFKLWFMFDSKTDALDAFNKLKDMFDEVSHAKKIFKKSNKLIAQFTDEANLNRANSVEFILTEDELYDNKYKIMFRIGSFTYP